MFSDLNGSLWPRQFLNVTNERTCFASCVVIVLLRSSCRGSFLKLHINENILRGCLLSFYKFVYIIHTLYLSHSICSFAIVGNSVAVKQGAMHQYPTHYMPWPSISYTHAQTRLISVNKPVDVMHLVAVDVRWIAWKRTKTNSKSKHSQQLNSFWFRYCLAAICKRPDDSRFNPPPPPPPPAP